MQNKIDFETFQPLSEYSANHLIQTEPTAFNGVVRIRKYRIRCEEVPESTEMLCNRLQELWDKCDNFHHWNPIKSEAKKLGYELKGSAGSKKLPLI